MSVMCSKSQDYECKKCTQCILGATYQSRPCGLDGRDRECAPCTNLAACPADTYKRSVCTLEENTDCYPCSKHPCPEGYFESAPCNATSDRVCSKCSTACPAGQFQSSECGGKLDIGCSPCSLAVCQDGFYLSTCSGRSDSACKACSAPCVDGTTYESQPCTKLTDRVCKPCSVCTGNNYVLSRCRGADDTKCGLCRRGSNSMYDYTATDFHPMELVPWATQREELMSLCLKLTERGYVEDTDCKKKIADEYELLLPAFPRAMEQDSNYKTWKSSKSQILDPSKPNYCAEFKDDTEGTCMDMEFESKRCRGPPPSVEDDPSKDFFVPYFTGSSRFPWICPSNPMRWLVNFNAYHTCSLCRPPCNSPTRWCFCFGCILCEGKNLHARQKKIAASSTRSTRSPPALAARGTCRGTTGSARAARFRAPPQPSFRKTTCCRRAARFRTPSAGATSSAPARQGPT